MTRVSMRLVRVLPVILLVPLLTGCTGKLSFTSTLQSAINTTTKLPRHFVYTEKHAGRTTEVTGVIEDDFRYSASLTVDGNPVAAEVMRDDARALKMSAELINKLNLYKNAVSKGPVDVLQFSDLATPPPDAAASTPNPGGAVIPPVNRYASQPPQKSTLDLLAQGNWVVDPQGAGPLGRLRQTARPPQLGDDPIADALTALGYVHDISAAGDFARLYNPDAVDYRPDLDPFPPPDKGVLRIDFQSAGAPARVATATGTIDALRAAVPDVEYYRTISVYVKDGVIQQIRESVNIKRRLIADSADDILGRIVDAGIKVPDYVRNGSADDQAKFVLAVKNRFNSERGTPLIRERELTVDFSYPTPAPTVLLPTGALAAFLGGVGVRGEIVSQGAVK